MFLSLIFNVFWFVFVQREKIVPLVFTVCDKLARKSGRAFILCAPNLTHSLTCQFPLKAKNTRWRKILAQHLSIMNLAGTRHSTQFYLVVSFTPILDPLCWSHITGKHIWTVLSTLFRKKENARTPVLLLGRLESQETGKTGAYVVSKMAWRHCFVSCFVLLVGEYYSIRWLHRYSHSHPLYEFGYTANGINGLGKLMTPSFHWNETERIIFPFRKRVNGWNLFFLR